MNEPSTSVIAISLGALVVSFFALVVSIFNLWFTNLRRGQILLSQPTIFFFGWDKKQGDDLPKIMFRSAIFCSAKRGAVLESMHLVVHNQNGKSTFSFWGYDDGKGMVRGSGLFIGDTGHVAYHHFNPPRNEKSFDYCLGEYTIEVWGRIFGEDADFRLGTYKFNVFDDDLVMMLKSFETGVVWDWLPQSRSYVGVARK